MPRPSQCRVCGLFELCFNPENANCAERLEVKAIMDRNKETINTLIQSEQSAKPQPSMEVMQAQMDLLVELHQAMNMPWFNIFEFKGELTRRKRVLRNKIKEAKRNAQARR